MFSCVSPSESMKIRTSVFADEQGFVDMPDEIDKLAVHIVGYEGEQAVATCRLFKECEDGDYILGRFAVIKEFRGQGRGRALLREAEKYISSIGARTLKLHSQYQAKGFYERCGYTVKGEVEYEQGEPHIWLEREI